MLGLTIGEGPTELRAPGPRDPTIRHWIYSGAGFTVAFGRLSENSPCTSDYSQQCRVLIVITLLSHICSMEPCTKACPRPIISSDNRNKKAIHTWPCFCLCVHCHFQTLQTKVFILIFLVIIPPCAYSETT